MYRTIIALLSLASVAHASAVPSNAAWAGVWHGTLGTQPITLCINASDFAGLQYGSYYYDRHLKPIHLEKQAADLLWKEISSAGETGLWELHADGDALTGRWTNPKSGQALPLALKIVERAADIDSEDPKGNCGGDAYNKALEAPIALKPGKAQQFEGKPYRTLTAMVAGDAELKLEMLQLQGQGKTLQAINKLLLAPLTDSALDGAENSLYSCRREGLRNLAEPGYYRERSEIKLWTRRWLVVETCGDNFCGGAHPSSGCSAQTFDMTAGEGVDTAGWIKPAAAADGNAQRSPALQALLIKRLRASPGYDEECSPVIEANEDYEISLARGGLAFATSLPHASSGCDATVLLDLAALKPFLTPAGAQAMDALQADLGKP